MVRRGAVESRTGTDPEVWEFGLELGRFVRARGTGPEIVGSHSFVLVEVDSAFCKRQHERLTHG